MPDEGSSLVGSHLGNSGPWKGEREAPEGAAFPLPAWRPAREFIIGEWQGLLIRGCSRPQGINSADPRLAWVRHPGYQLCPRGSQLQIAYGGEVVEDGTLRERSSAIFQQISQQPEIKAKERLLQDPPGGSLRI